jgi:hypothetical protein
MVNHGPDACRAGIEGKVGATEHCHPKRGGASAPETRWKSESPRARRRHSWPACGCALASLIVLTVVLVCSGSALADTATITVTTTTGQSDPAAGVPRLFTVSGTTASGTANSPERLFVKYRAPGGSPCAPTPGSDPGSYVTEKGGTNFDGSYGSLFNGDAINGSFNPSFSFQAAVTWGAPGTYVFCIWLTPDNPTPVTPYTQQITFRSPTGTISATVNPIMPTPGQQATITVTGASEASKKVYATIRSAGGQSCATTFGADTGTSLIDGTNVDGMFTMQATTTQATAGTYLICLWLADSSNDSSPIAGPQPETFMVASPPPPPPPCVVPSFRSNTRLSTIEGRIRAAHCSVGKIHYASSRRYRRGILIKLSPRPGTRLPSNAAIGVLLSSGRAVRHKR